MFLVAITKTKIKSTFQSLNVKQLHLKLFVITIVTDNFLSRLIKNEKGFSVIESTFISSDNFQDIILGQAIFKEHNNTLEMFKPTISGRPIYYHINSNGEFFCSTHIALLREAGVVIQENRKALPEFFAYRYVMPPRTLYKDIEQVMTGSRISITFNNEKCQIASLSNFNPPEPDEKLGSFKKITEQTLHLLTESIQALNPYKEKLSVLQSGGLDSSILYQICRNLFGSGETYSTGFPFEDPANNLEKEYSLSASKALKSKHTYYEFSTKEYLCGLIKGISIAEEPLHHVQSVLLNLLFGKIPHEKNVVISGLGADGIFGPEINRYIYRLNSLPLKLFLKPMRFLHVSSLNSTRLRRLLKTDLKLHKSFDDPDSILWTLGCHGSKEWVCSYFGISDYDIIEGRYHTIRLFEHRSIHDVISLYSFLGSASFTKSIWSKFGESQGKIIHYPYCDDNLVNYLYTIPWAVKLKNSKNILRKIAKNIDVSDFIINRPKQSFGIAADKWGEKGGVFEPLVPVCAKVFDIREIHKMQSFKREKAMTFWNIMNYSLWKRLCINNESTDLLLDELNDNLTEGFKGSKNLNDYDLN